MFHVSSSSSSPLFSSPIHLLLLLCTLFHDESRCALTKSTAHSIQKFYDFSFEDILFRISGWNGDIRERKVQRMSLFSLAEVKGTEAEKANGKAASIPAAEESGKKERSVLQAKLTRLAIQIGYAGEHFLLRRDGHQHSCQVPSLPLALFSFW